jgi:hypothetical protein
MRPQDVLRADSWETYWPSAQLEKRLFLDGWLKDFKKEGPKHIEAAEWEYCQDPGYEKLKRILSQVAAWRHVMGRLRVKKAIGPPKAATKLSPADPPASPAGSAGRSWTRFWRRPAKLV